MRFGYWLPVFGGWLRNVDDEHMAATWDYVKTLARQSEKWGYDLTLIAGHAAGDLVDDDDPLAVRVVVDLLGIGVVRRPERVRPEAVGHPGHAPPAGGQLRLAG